MKLTVTKSGVWLDDYKISNCTQVDIENISPIDHADVVLHIVVDEVDIQYAPELLRHELSEKR